ncbi:MAG: hypothetical protein IJ515_03360 [Clostridia bacterium]|nr:hypothetical protein [Clostridia bacterium]
MTVQEAYIQIDTAIEKYVPQLQELGLVVKKRIFYTDKNLVQMQEFTDKSILIFGDIAIGCEGMEDEDFCNYSVCAEITTALVKDESLEKNLAEFKTELDMFLERIGSAENSDEYEKIIAEITKEQEAEAEAAALEFANEMKKARTKILIAIGSLIAVLAVIVFVAPLLI